MTERLYVAILKACAKKKDLQRGSRVHADVLKWGWLEEYPFVANTLVSMYAKCGALGKAQRVLEELPVRDVVCWSALISGYAQQGHGQEALACLELMQQEGLSPNAVTFICILKACGSIGAAEKGEEIHDEIARLGLLGSDIVLGNALVDMYAKCGSLAKARQVLEELPVRDVVSWSSLIAGYAQEGQGQDALDCFERMKGEGLSPDIVAFVSTLKACGSIGAADKGERIHDEISKQGLVGHNIVLGNALVDMYAKCGALSKARRVLEDLPVRDVVTWNTLIGGYAQQGQAEEALNSYRLMQDEGVPPDKVTFTCLLNACGNIGSLDEGKQIHDEILKEGSLGNDIVLGNALVDMYARCGELAKAEEVLNELSEQNVVSWSALIEGYSQKGQDQDAIFCLERMRQKGLSPDAVMFISILKACGSIGAADKGEQIHHEILREGMLKNNLVLGNALVDMYVKCGAFAKAQSVLGELPIQDVVSWNTLLAGYAQHGQAEEALNCLRLMQRKGLSPVEVTFTCILKACGSLGSVDKGEQIHEEISKQGLLQNNVVLGNALVDMYAKCGALATAQRVLSKLPVQDVVSWNALMAGYAQQGQFKEVLNCFEWIEHKELCPDTITFACVLNACSHAGLVEEGQMYFSKISTKYNIAPNSEHYTCMVDLFGRAGHLDKAVMVIEKMPTRECPAVWSALLSACRKWGDVSVGRWAFENAVQVDRSDSAAYICMANIYVGAGMQEDAKLIEVMRVQNKAWKKQEHSWWLDMSKNVHSFFISDTSSKYVLPALEGLVHKGQLYSMFALRATT